jgi:hypothetical protein
MAARHNGTLFVPPRPSSRQAAIVLASPSLATLGQAMVARALLGSAAKQAASEQRKIFSRPRHATRPQAARAPLGAQLQCWACASSARRPGPMAVQLTVLTRLSGVKGEAGLKTRTGPCCGLVHERKTHAARNDATWAGRCLLQKACAVAGALYANRGHSPRMMQPHTKIT